MIGLIAQVIEVEDVVTGLPDMGLTITVRSAVRVLPQYEAGGGKKWWKAAIQADSDSVWDTWRNAPGNIGWKSDQDPSDADADKIWSGLQPALQAELPPTHTGWFLAPGVFDVNGVATGPLMIPAVGFDSTFLHIDALRNLRERGLWSADISAGQGAAANAWLNTEGNIGISGDLPVDPDAQTRKFVKSIARDMAHETNYLMSIEPNA